MSCVPLPLVSRVLGHGSTATTDCYVWIAEHVLRSTRLTLPNDCPTLYLR